MSRLIEAGTQIFDQDGNHFATVEQSFSFQEQTPKAQWFRFADATQPIPNTHMQKPIVEFLNGLRETNAQTE